MANATAQPSFTHDCESCTFLGRYDGHDLYVCPADDPALIARFGSEGAEYRSLPASMLFTSQLPPIYLEIGRRCRKAGIRLKRQV